MSDRTQPERTGLKHGPLAGQDLSLLTDCSVLFSVRPVGPGEKPLPDRAPLEFRSVVLGRANIIRLKGWDGSFNVSQFNYIGEIGPGGWIHAPAGGWRKPPPFFGLTCCIRGKAGANLNRWQNVIAFRPAPSAVEPAPEYTSQDEENDNSGRSWPAPEAVSSEGEVFVSATCQGERCRCGEPAVRKVGEEIPSDDPLPHRHNLTAYVCAGHYAQLMGPLGARQVGASHTPEQPDAEGEAEFELTQDGDHVASTCGPRPKALAEIRHYAAVYGQDGPVEAFEVVRTPIDLETIR